MGAKSNRPPGPRGLPLLGVALELRRDPLSLLARVAREYGDLTKIPLGFGQSRVFANHPGLIEQVLVIQQQKFHKSAFAQRATRRLLGNGLLNSEGEFWRRQRRLAQPAFQRSRISAYGAAMAEQALAHTASWRAGEVRDLAEEMSRLTCAIAVKTLFGTDMGPEADCVGQHLALLMRYQIGRLRSPVRIPEWVPTPANRRATRAFQYLDSLVFGIIAERRARGDDGGGDLLSRLISAMDEDGAQMTPRQLRDETMTLFLAGHETTALTLAWSWYLLARHSAAEARLHEELSRALAGRAPGVEDLEALPYLDAVIREALRLYPPAYITSRTAIETFELGGYSFPAGTTVLLSQWVMHRDPRYFEDPLAFRPERWLDGLAARLPAHAYFPFGGGPRRCIGQGFAVQEAALVLAALAERFEFRLAPGQEVAPEPLVTLRAKNGMRMIVRVRR